MGKNIFEELQKQIEEMESQGIPIEIYSEIKYSEEKEYNWWHLIAEEQYYTKIFENNISFGLKFTYRSEQQHFFHIDYVKFNASTYQNQRNLDDLPFADKLNSVFHKIFSFPGISNLGFVGIFQVPSHKLRAGNWYIKVVSTNLILNARTFFVGAYQKEREEENTKKEKSFPWNVLPSFWCYEDHICLYIPNEIHLFAKSQEKIAATNGEEVFQDQISIPLHENSFWLLAIIYGEIIGFFFAFSIF